jgi:FKBP-type peptidyl-prolyl cis-trans isomerase
MDRKLGILIGLVVLIGVLVAAILIPRGGGSDDSSSGDLKNLDTKPKIEASSDPAPTTLEKEDIVVGDGAEAKAGDTVSVQYVGALYDNGKEFDASWDRNEPFTFKLGGGQVIKGWDEGVEGMKVGGRRKLIIPPDLGYGAQGSPPTIPANATLVFVVDLKSVEGK